ncbi:MAG: ABC transporter permease subunit [Bacteroidetes bacterium]|nr:ABC transporter permease subunit [Bacteroidota bacterium]
MRNSLIICRKELAGFFNSPAAYIVLLVFALLTSWFFSNTFFLANQSDLRALFDIVPMVYLFFVPAITMSLIARENQSGTIEFITTLPISDHEIVLGKFLAGLSLIAFALSLTAVHAFTLIMVGDKVDTGALLSGYLGLMLVGAVYTAIGLFGSAVTDNQIAAFIVSIMIILTMFLLDKMLVLVPASIASVLQYLSVDYHLSNISKGVVDSRNLIYFGSVIAFFLLVSIRILEIRKWK